MIDTETILSTIWERSEGAYVFRPCKNPHVGWYEGDAIPVEEAADPDHGLEIDGYDDYYTPGRYIGTERKKENHGPMGVLYADLDDKFDRDRLRQIPPQLLTETSHGRYQAVWLLAEPLAVSAAEDLNKRLSHFMQADHGSWIITKVLRVPGTLNYKRGGQKVTVERWDPYTEYRAESLNLLLPEVEAQPISEEVAHPQPPSSEASRAWIKGVWPKLDHRTKQMLAISNPIDRSLHLSRLAKRMAACGLGPDTIFFILYNLPCNKFRNRPQVLWESVILTAY